MSRSTMRADICSDSKVPCLRRTFRRMNLQESRLEQGPDVIRFKSLGSWGLAVGVRAGRARVRAQGAGRNYKVLQILQSHTPRQEQQALLAHD
jgi:hypothetical protein